LNCFKRTNLNPENRWTTIVISNHLHYYRLSSNEELRLILLLFVFQISVVPWSGWNWERALVTPKTRYEEGEFMGLSPIYRFFLQVLFLCCAFNIWSALCHCSAWHRKWRPKLVSS
jgi:hypothetical protein